MRDIQSMFWVAKVVFGLNGIDDFRDAGLMLEEERAEFVDSWDALIQLRNRLHYFSKRKNDQLYFELQEEVAEALGYVEEKGVLGVEQYMRDTYAHMENIAVTTDLFFDHVDEVLGLAVKQGEAVPDREVEKGIEIRRGRVHLTATGQQIASKPQLLMRVFLASARFGRAAASPDQEADFAVSRQNQPEGSGVAENVQGAGLDTGWGKRCFFCA